MSRTLRTAGAALAAAVLTAALATGCGPDTTTGGDGQKATNAAPSSVSSSALGTSRPTTVQIGRTAYWGGLKIDVKSATYKPATEGGYGYKVVLDTTVTNTFRTTAVRNWPDFAIDIAGTPLGGDYGSAVPPTPGASNPLTLTFNGSADADHAFTFDGASLVLGDASEAQAVVPLGKGGREAISLKPIDLKLPANTVLTSGRLSLSLKTAQLRADVGNNNGLKRGQRALLVVFDMTGHVGPAGMAVDGGILRLKLPNGQVVGPIAAPIEAIYPDRPTRQDQAAWFVFEGATDGDYTLSVTDTDTPPASVPLPATGLKDSGPVS
ncbi:hypothetical protein [Kitasatospora atroaurantiaca]|uniref:DUF4352 domain-containing protein n=1 Tax=Kitasatospora atroaurantiaca TaxID=285545 RepID=A0A561ELL5_9ACTN|nr:hypothetical protein [Kitasatospora atroaurantiaca]TWE16513.1 hypothetical protein FB465_1496 [Kitasatospora atroaurantiaca]